MLNAKINRYFTAKPKRYFIVYHNTILTIMYRLYLGPLYIVLQPGTVEKLIEFIECPVVTGEAVCQKVVGCLQGLTLDPAQCRAETYDGAVKMAGVINGCAANFINIVPQAHYYHCASHSLNLKTIAIFFTYSPKRKDD